MKVVKGGVDGFCGDARLGRRLQWREEYIFASWYAHNIEHERI
jgi:hypothetical protein